MSRFQPGPTQSPQGEGGVVVEMVSAKITEAKGLLAKVDDMNKNQITGASKLKKRIQAEINSLTKVLRKDGEIKKEYVTCSNLGQLGALSTVAATIPNVTGVLQTFSTWEIDDKLSVDIVADNGKHWIKVIMRNPKALHRLFIYGCRRGTKPLSKVAEEFMIYAKNHQVFYMTPKVTFWFCNGVSQSLADAIEDKGVQVYGNRFPDNTLGIEDFNTNDSDSEDGEKEENTTDSDGTLVGEDVDDSYNIVVGAISGPGKQPKQEGVYGPKQQEGVYIPKQREEVYSQSFAETPIPESKNSPTSVRNQAKIKKLKLKPSKQNSETTDLPCLLLDNLNFNQTGDCKRMNLSQERRKINLDITAMIAYVTATTNGGANYIFKDKILAEQAECERKNPVKKVLDSYFEDSELIACQEAVDHFLCILGTVGGEGEKCRAQELLSRLTITPGLNFLKDRVRKTGKVSTRALLVFGTGLAHCAITVTSNRTFIRSAEQQGVKLAVFFHEPRALTEAKECSAVPL